MAITNLAPGDSRARSSVLPASMPPATEAHASAVSWGAIIAGAAGAAALSLILLILGTGLGLSSVSPWTSQGASATTIGLSTILWLTLTQLAASGMGGYLAGRLRTRWAAVAADEVYFRDTAHGFLAWAAATLATAALLTSAVGTIVGGGLQAGAALTSGVSSVATGVASAAAGGAAAKPAGTGDAESAYFLDSLFRADPSTTTLGTGTSPAAAPTPGNDAASSAAVQSGSIPAGADQTTIARGASGANGGSANTAEVGRIFINSIGSGALPADDAKYVGQIVAHSTGLSPQEADRRVTDTYVRMQTKLRDTETAARDAADKVRKSSAHTALWLFVSLLCGAFVASWAATWGGRRRDL